MAAEKKLLIKPFQMEKLFGGCCILVLGARGTGKTTIAKDILYSLRKYKYGVCMVGSFDTESEWAKHIPQLLIYSKYCPHTVRKLMLEQAKLLRIVKDRDLLRPCFIILDDLMYDKRIFRCPYFRQLCLNGRHYNITCIVLAQYLHQCSAELRPQIDFVFMTVQKNKQQQKKILEAFDVGFPTLSSFRKTMLICTENFGTMVLDRRSRGVDLSDSVYYHNPPLARLFKIGSRALWQMSNARFNPDYHMQFFLADDDEKDKSKVEIRKINV